MYADPYRLTPDSINIFNQQKAYPCPVFHLKCKHKGPGNYCQGTNVRIQVANGYPVGCQSVTPPEKVEGWKLGR